MQPADILVFSRKMLNTIVFPPNFEFNRKLSTKMLPPNGIQQESPAGPRPSKAPGDGSAKIDNAATAAKNAILAFVASSLGEGDFRLNLDMDYKKSVSKCNCKPFMA